MRKFFIIFRNPAPFTVMVAIILLLSFPILALATKKKNSFTTTEVTEAFYDKAWLNFQIGSKKERLEVINALKAIVRKKPEEFMAHYYLGIMFAEEGSPAIALKHLRTALVGFPKSADINVRIAKILDQQNKVDEAIKHYREAIKLDPNNGTALSRVGIAEFEMGNIDLAFELLCKARESQPENVETLRALGKVMTKRGDNQEAIKVLKQALLFDERHSGTHLLLAKAYENLGKFEQATNHYELAKKYGRKYPETKQLIGYNLARSLMECGKYEEAEAEFKKAIKISEDPAKGYFELAHLYNDIGREDEAIKNFKKAYEIDQQYGEGIFISAEIYEKREDYDKAANLYKALRRNQNFSDRAQQALKELENRCELDKKLELEAKLKDQHLDDKTLESTYLEILDNNKKDESALKGLWKFYEERGYYEDALKYFRRYNRIRPVSDYQKKLIEKELKNKLKQDNYTIFGYKEPIAYKDIQTSKEDLIQLAYYGENDRLKELAFDILAYRIAKYKENRSMSEDKAILEKRLEFYEERGKLDEALKIVNALKRYGWWTAYEASEKRRQLREKLKK